VLSGFLITGILLRCRDARGSFLRGDARKFQLRQFYVRRILRIVPLFYAVVLAAAIINIRPARETLLWHLGYASNVLMALQNGWSGPLSHFWTLAVEEQFYLVWPCLILFLPRKFILPTMIGAIAIAPIYRIVSPSLGINPIAIEVLLFGALDFLGIGALLAFFQHTNAHRWSETARSKTYICAGVVTSLALLASAFLAPRFEWLGMVAAPLFFAWLIHKAAHGFDGPLGRGMQWKPLLYLGQISYGLYIFHKLLTTVVPHGFQILHLPYPSNVWVQVVLLMIINVLLASVSWFVLERPINRLKRHFNYAR